MEGGGVGVIPFNVAVTKARPCVVVHTAVTTVNVDCQQLGTAKPSKRDDRTKLMGKE